MSVQLRVILDRCSTSCLCHFTPKSTATHLLPECTPVLAQKTRRVSSMPSIIQQANTSSCTTNFAYTTFEMESGPQPDRHTHLADHRDSRSDVMAHFKRGLDGFEGARWEQKSIVDRVVVRAACGRIPALENDQTAGSRGFSRPEVHRSRQETVLDGDRNG